MRDRPVRAQEPLGSTLLEEYVWHVTTAVQGHYQIEACLYQKQDTEDGKKAFHKAFHRVRFLHSSFSLIIDYS